jgi:ELWxxDGT repeat protein
MPTPCCSVEALEARALLSALNPTNLLALGNRLFFIAEDGSHGQELWVSDGTASGTRMVRDINPGAAGANIIGLTPFGNRVAFAADDGSHGMELWLSDGTSAGTVLVKDILDGGQSGFPLNIKAAGSTLYFSAGTNSLGRELWKSDGTAAGTVFVKDIYQGSTGSGSGGFTDVNGTVFFTADSAVTTGNGNHQSTTFFGRELWKTNGTAAGTVMVRDINEGFADSGPEQFTLINGRLVFAARTDELGTEIWTSDGTSTGTVLLRDINPTFRSSNPFGMRDFQGTAYFDAIDGDFNYNLWRSDGTTAGTVAATDFAPGFTGFIPANFEVTGNVVFFATPSPTGSLDLWRTDQTAAGTFFVRQMLPPEIVQLGEVPVTAKAAGQFLFFTAFDSATGVELHVSDGTIAGTRLLKDIFPGANPFNPQPSDMTAVGTRLFFTADDGVHGSELWVSNGTSSGTRRVDDNHFAMPIDPLQVVSQPVARSSVLSLLADADDELSFLWIDASSSRLRSREDVIQEHVDDDARDRHVKPDPIRRRRDPPVPVPLSAVRSPQGHPDQRQHSDGQQHVRGEQDEVKGSQRRRL